MIHGIDVSHHNPPALVPVEVDFAIVRITFGTVDGRVLHDGVASQPMPGSAEKHLARLVSVPVLVGYHYLATGEGSASGEEQAAAFLARRAELQARFGVVLGCALDSEPLRDRDGAGNKIPWDAAERVCDRVLGFHQAISDAGLRMVSYGSREWWARLGLRWWYALSSPFWAASQGAPPAPWTSTSIQQTGKAGGIDRNIFHGSVEELRELFGLPPPMTPPP